MMPNMVAMVVERKGRRATNKVGTIVAIVVVERKERKAKRAPVTRARRVMGKKKESKTRLIILYI